MEQSLMIVNGSPRAPRSNSKGYAALVRAHWRGPVVECSALEQSDQEILEQAGQVEHILLVFPLYVDTLPVPLIRLLQAWEQTPPQKAPTIHVLINCGFLEVEQNRVAVDTVALFCQKNGLSLGSVMMVGSGEAILRTPFAGLVKGKAKQLAASMQAGRKRELKVAMPLPKGLFLRASTRYWLGLGEKHGQTRESMSTMEIEGQLPPF